MCQKCQIRCPPTWRWSSVAAPPRRANHQPLELLQLAAPPQGSTITPSSEGRSLSGACGATCHLHRRYWSQARQQREDAEGIQGAPRWPGHINAQGERPDDHGRDRVPRDRDTTRRYVDKNGITWPCHHNDEDVNFENPGCGGYGHHRRAECDVVHHERTRSI